VAGVDKEARAAAEAAVQRAFAGRERDPWSISLVLLGSKWSVTLSGPTERLRHVSFIADPQRLEQALGEALAGQASGPESAATTAAGATAAAPSRRSIQDRYECEKCRKQLRVSYEGQPEEPKERAPVACPHCWGVIHVEIGAWAATGGDYRAEKL
jgi:DNA-directed RNA polymerase subunit RPC12/RpoP